MIKTSLIAPCGMNCAVCLGYIREKNKCPGCREIDPDKAKSCRHCRIVKCAVKKKGYKYCFSCKIMPCARLKHLDKRYRTNYGMSMLENLANIKRLGIRKFVINETRRWKCPKCGELICVHRWYCPWCGVIRKHS